MLPRPNYRRDVYNFENMEEDFDKGAFESETCDVYLAFRDGEDKSIPQNIRPKKPCGLPGYDDCAQDSDDNSDDDN